MESYKLSLVFNQVIGQDYHFTAFHYNKDHTYQYINLTLPSPGQIKVEGYNDSLAMGLHWYFEHYTKNTSPVNQERAKAIMKTLYEWGYLCFCNIYSNFTPRLDVFTEITICSDMPHVLTWPWEAVCNFDIDFAFGTSNFSRIQRNATEKLFFPLQNMSQSQTLNILYVLARSSQDEVGFLTQALPLADFIANNQLPINLKILRPATLESLDEELNRKPDFYHIVHFDGHGVHNTDDSFLYFEGEDNFTYEPVLAEKFVDIIKKYKIPYVVLNACKSSENITSTKDRFASVASHTNLK